MTDFRLMWHAQTQYLETFDSWSVPEFNQWLEEKWGVQYCPKPSGSCIDVVDEAKYLLFLMTFS